MRHQKNQRLLFGVFYYEARRDAFARGNAGADKARELSAEIEAENVGTYSRENPDIRYSRRRGGRKLKDYEFFIADRAAFRRLSGQVGTLWHDKDDIDAYYLDEFVFICKKGEEYGKFEILDILSQNSTPDEIERCKEEARQRMTEL